MSAGGDRLRARFNGLRVRVVVKELEEVLPADSQGDPAIYASPFTLRDRKRLARFIDADDDEGFAQVIIDKAQAEDGSPLFDIGDKSILMDCVEAHIVARVGQSLMASVSLEAARGN